MAGIVIAGCHRSGTSALAGALAELGWVLPRDMVAAGRGNLRGHFEPQAVVQANDGILDACGRLWFDPKPLPADWLERRVVRDALDNAPALLSGEFDGRPYLVKDPRLSLLLPVWLAPLQEIGGPPVVLIACRNPYEVAKSLKRRDGFSVPHGLSLWQSYMLAAERNSRGLARLVVHFEALLEDGPPILARICELASDGGRPGAETMAAAARSLASGERHVRSARDEFLGNDRIAADIRDLYRKLLEPGCLEDNGFFDAAHDAWLARWQSESEGGGPSAMVMKTAAYWQIEGQKALVAGNVAAALKHVRKGLALNPDEAGLHLMRGKILLRGGEVSGAIQSLREALRIEPDLAGAASQLGAALRAAGDSEEAIAVVRKGLDGRPDDVELLTLLGQILAERDEGEAAVYQVGLAAGLGGMTAQLALLMCAIFRKAGRKPVAHGYARQAFGLAADDVRLQIQAAVQLAKCGGVGEAEALLRGLAVEGDMRGEAQAALDRVLARRAPVMR